MLRSWVVGILAVVPFISFAQDAEDGEHDWFFSDFEERITEVNDGQLVFLGEVPDPRPHYHNDIVTVTASSLDDGWVGLSQCHYQMDEISRVEVVFRGDSVRSLSVESSQGIGRSWVEDGTLQLEDVEKGATLCIRGELQALHKIDTGGVQVRMGPFMRRFLDGFYPIGVTLRVDYPCERLRLREVWPPAQPGLRVRRQACSVELEAWFEGALITLFNFDGPLAE